MVNSAPITPYHSLLIPSRMRCKPQVLDYEGLLLGIASVLASKTPALKVGFNSLGGMASVNHYHLHIYYLPFSIFVETAECEKRVGPLYTFKDHYAPGFVFQLHSQDIEDTARNVDTLIKFLVEEEVCHNVMIARGVSNRRNEEYVNGLNYYDTVRICVWIRKPTFGIKHVEGFATALCEFSGHLPVYDDETWKNITEEDVEKTMKEACLETYTKFLPKIEKLFA